MSTVVTDSYSDQDMACPADWENGYKPARVTRWGDSEFSLSHPWSGEWQGSRFTYEVSDKDGLFRAQLASPADRYWTRPHTVRMTSRANRAQRGAPYTVFHGPVIDAQPNAKRRLEVTLGDLVSQVLFQNQSDKFRIPWRVIGDGFLSQLDSISDRLDRETPEPIIYGTHNRTTTSLATPAGFRIVPTYLGRWTPKSGGSQYHVWLLAGHACKSVDIYLDSGGGPVLRAESDGWLIPTHANFLAEFGAPYVDLRSDTFSNDRRYCLVLGEVGGEADDVVVDDSVLTCDVKGVEGAGDGSGALITDAYQQRKHFDIHYVANPGPTSYQTGFWADHLNPSWDIFGTSVQIIDETTYDDATAIGILRKPDSNGLIGAAVIGRSAGDRYNAPKWDADWNRSTAARSGWTRHGQKLITLLHPTQAIKDAAPLFSDSLHISKDSFRPSIRWGDQANSVPFRCDFDASPGASPSVKADGLWRTTGTRTADQSIVDYERVIPSETREYPFAPGLANGQHIADLEVAIRQHPPRAVGLDTSVSARASDGTSLADLRIGDYFRYIHFDAVQQTRSIRLAQIEKAGVRVGRRRIYAEAIDVEDLIGYDDHLPGDPDLQSGLCAMALPIDLTDGGSDTWHIDTTNYLTDDSIEGLFPGPGIAYHAAWWEFTAPDDGSLSLITFGYDTQIVVFTGTCAALDLYDYDDTGVFGRARSTFNVVAGETYRIVVAGYGPNDAGTLTFQATFRAS